MRTNVLPRITVAALLSLALPAFAEDPAGSPSPLPQKAAPEPTAKAPPAPLPVPTGSKEDRELWTSCGNIGNQLTSARTQGAQLHWRIKTGDLHARLQAAAKADPSEAKQLDQVRAELLEAQVSSYDDLMGRWPVDKTRGCQYPQLALGSAMQAAATRDNRAELAQVRETATRCLELAHLTLRRVQQSSEALARALEAAEKALPFRPPAPVEK
jgi:hypothetical protein